MKKHILRHLFRINRRHKDRLFIRLFGTEKFKENALSLYNALSNTNYTNPDDLEFNTIEDVLYMGMHNDISFILCESEISLWEQQSTFNPNMPLRNLIYLGQLYSKYLKTKHLEKSLYSSKICTVPAPKLIVFYNGTSDQPERNCLRLSDAFSDSKAGDVEVTVSCLNINYGRNQELLDSCTPLHDYALFISLVRDYNRAMSKKAAVARAISELPDGIVKQYLEAHKTEATNMFLAEYDEESILLAHRRDGYADGKADGIAIGETKGIAIGKSEGIAIGEARGRADGYFSMVSKGRITVAEASEDLGISENEFLQNMSAAGYKLPEKV